jgi:hypothetical protein
MSIVTTRTPDMRIIPTTTERMIIHWQAIQSRRLPGPAVAILAAESSARRLPAWHRLRSLR